MINPDPSCPLFGDWHELIDAAINTALTMVSAVTIGDLQRAAELAERAAVINTDMKEWIEDVYGPNEELDETNRRLLARVDALGKLVSIDQNTKLM